MAHRGLLLAVLLLMSSPGLCQTGLQTTPSGSPQVLTLDEAVRTALEKHPALRGAEAAVAAAEAEVKQVRAGYFPQLSFSGIGKIGLSGATGALGLPGFPGSPFFRNLAYSANWYQNIFDFGRTKHRVASRERLAKNARLKKQAERDRILLAVRRAYFSVLEAQRLDRLAESTVRERRLTLERVEAYFQAQMRSQMDVNLSRANLLEEEGGLIKARNAVHSAFAALRSAMGVEGRSTYELRDPQVQILQVPPLEDQVKAALENRPDLKALGAKIEALSEEAGVARSDRFPELAGFAATGQGRFEGTPVKKNQRHGVGALGIFFPFFTAGRLKAREQEARAELEVAWASRDLLRQQINLEVTQAYYNLTDLAERIGVAAEQERVSHEALRLAQARFKHQLASFLEGTTAEVALTRAETSHARALFDYQRARADLEFAIGQSVNP
jgi:outer membrane protein TolC